VEFTFQDQEQLAQVEQAAAVTDQILQTVQMV
jgi:hypothetical protein